MSHVNDAKRRREDKLRAARGKQNLILAAIILIVILAAIGGYYLLNSDVWLLKTIAVTGNDRVSADKISALAGLNEETNLMKISKDAIEAAIEKDPHIASAQAQRDLPSRLDIVVTERKPVARVKQAGKLFLLDRHGFVIEATMEATSDTVPVINEVKSGRLRVGKRVKVKILRDTLKSLLSLTPELRKTVVWISVPSLDKLAFHTDNDLEIIYGDAREARKKNQFIKAILSRGDGNVVHINVTSPDNPVVRKLSI